MYTQIIEGLVATSTQPGRDKEKEKEWTVG